MNKTQVMGISLLLMFFVIIILAVIFLPKFSSGGSDALFPEPEFEERLECNCLNLDNRTCLKEECKIIRTKIIR